MMRPRLDAIDRTLIQAAQGGLPLVAQPYHAIAEQMGVSPDVVMRRLRELQTRGVIQRIGAIPEEVPQEWSGTLLAWDVINGHVDRLGALIGALDPVMQCHRRRRHLPEWRYNLLTLVEGSHKDEIKKVTDEITKMLYPYCRAHIVLFCTRILKKDGFRI